MEEIKLGDFVKTKKGILGRVISRGYGLYDIKVGNDSMCCKTSDILKHSDNIFNLIEVGDYVNWHRIEKIGKDPLNGQRILFTEHNTCSVIIFRENSPKSINTVLTKEQYLANCLKIY